MTEIVGEHETGRIRVFHFEPIGDDGPMVQFKAAIGVIGIDVAHVQHVIISDLGDMTLTQFLAQAYEVTGDALATYAAQLNELTGSVFIVRSSAFPDRPETLKTDGAARLIAKFREPSLDTTSSTSLDTESAEGILTPPPSKKKPTDAAMGGRVATIVLILMALLVWVMIKIAG